MRIGAGGGGEGETRDMISVASQDNVNISRSAERWEVCSCVPKVVSKISQ